MKDMERKKICQFMVGSHLYGTNSESSDEDFAGVFIPSRRDLLSISAYPHEIWEGVKRSDGPRNEKGDVDSKFYSLARFMDLASEGQPGQLELLFAKPCHAVIPPALEWEKILGEREVFLSKSAIIPFIGFAEAQAHKAQMKGENLNLIRRLMSWGHELDAKMLGRSIREHLLDSSLGGEKVLVFKNDSGADLVEIAGRKFDLGTPLKRLLDSLELLEKRYGKRSEAAARQGVDWKSVHHAIRLTIEAEDLLRRGEIVLPFEGQRLSFLLDLKQGRLTEFDWAAFLRERIELLKETREQSRLPDKPQIERIHDLHREIIEECVFSR